MKVTKRISKNVKVKIKNHQKLTVVKLSFIVEIKKIVKLRNANWETFELRKSKKLT